MSPPSGKKPIINTNVSKEKDLYTKLLNRCRSPADSMQVVAFLMWLQTLIVTHVPDLLIGKMMKLPIKVMDALAGEIMDCLKCVQSQIMPFTEGAYDISLLRAFVSDATQLDITLHHFYRHRCIVIKGVREMVKAFNGIYEEEEDDESSTASSSTVRPRISAIPGKSSVRRTQPKAEGVGVKRHLPYCCYHREEEDGRTIFLTFSKGYPIPAHEIASFFNKKCGRHVVDKIYTKNVKEKEQVMCARMVCTDPAAVNAIVDPHGCMIAKYFIRGRQVWARKYIKRYRSASV